MKTDQCCTNSCDLKTEVPVDVGIDCDNRVDELCIEKLNSLVVCSKLNSCADVCTGTERVGNEMVTSEKRNITEKCVIDVKISTVKLNFQSIFGLVYLWIMLW